MKFSRASTDVNVPQPYNQIGDGPEGPEVAKMADSLQNLIQGWTMTEIILTSSAQHDRLDSTPLPSRVERVYSYGKKILFDMREISPESGHDYSEKALEEPQYQKSEVKLKPQQEETRLDFERGDGGRRFLIGNALAMTGHWSLKSSKHVRFSFKFTNGQMLYFSEPRPFSKTYLLDTSESQRKYFARLGPDLLRENISKEDWCQRMRKKTKRKRSTARPISISDALLEQDIYAGIGNYLRADIMYEARVHPLEAVQDMSDEELDRVRVASLSLIRKAYESDGFTMHDYRDVNDHEDSYITLVYGQKVDRLGNPVVLSNFPGKHAGRVVHWVPAVQKRRNRPPISPFTLARS
jgi:formamidopyrimidine-DNA glycosylase